jgi:2-polyprenyl-3-methyl-5-hydroxy-6-metoxy-1,4-benzoquinol methylase
MNQFDKYEEKGPYHWKALYGEGWMRSSPRLHARYDIPIRLLSSRLNLENSTGLDVGCGDGVLLYKIRKLGGDIVGLDTSETGLQLAKEQLETRGVLSTRLINSSCYEMPFDDGRFDYVTSVELIEHLQDVNRFLREVRRILRPGGWFVCTTPNRKENQAPDTVRDPFHVHEFSPAELSKTLSKVFKTTEVYGAYPSALDKLYVRNKRLECSDKVARLVFRAFSFLFFNPYVERLDDRPTTSNSLLVSVSKQ